jgi:cytochrome P450
MTTYPPGPKFNTFDMLKFQLMGALNRSKEGESFEFLAAAVEWTKQYGDLVYWNFWPNQAYIVNNPDDIHDVLVTNADRFNKAPFYKLMLSRFLGNGILVSDGDFWRRQRKLAQPAFHHKRIESYATNTIDYSLQLMETWHDGQQIDALDEMMKLTLAIVAKSLFNADVTGRSEVVGKSLNDLQETSTEQSKSFLSMMIPQWVPTAMNRRQKAATQALDEIIMGFIRERRASGEDKGDLLSMLLAAQDDEGIGMTDKEARDEAITLFLAGYETTSNAMSWTWMLLSQNPEVEAKLHEELDTVLGGRAPTFADLPKLKYTEWVIKESLRLYPPAHAVGRQAMADVEIGGYTIPEKSIVFIYPYIVHRNPRWFPEPEAFKPERWANDYEKQIPKYAYFPFGGGPRICIGNQFALMEARLILATIAQHYRVRVQAAQPIKPEPLITLRPGGGVPAKLEIRQKSEVGKAVHAASI